jgi:hypothetical protein
MGGFLKTGGGFIDQGGQFNPLELLQALVQGQQPQQMAPPAPAEPAMRPPEPRVDVREDEDTSIMDNFIRGFINRASAQGEAVPAERFQERFRDTISPGREFLANLLYGVSSGFTGEKFRDVRERKFQQFQAEEQLKLAATQRQTQQAQVIAQALAMKEKLGQMRELQQIRSIENKEKRANEMSKFMLKTNQDMAKFEEVQRHNVELEKNAKRPKDADLDWALTQAKGIMAQEMNLDPNDPKNEVELHKMAVEIDSQRVQNTAKIKALTARQYGPAKAAPRDRLQVKDITNGFGEKEFGVYNLDKGNWSKAPEHWDQGTPRDFSPADVGKLEEAQNAISGLRNAARLALANPDSVGSFIKSLDPKWLAMLGNVDGNVNQREIFRSLKNAMNSQIRAYSGLATTKSEEERSSAGFASMAEKAETFVPGVLGYSAMVEAQLMRARSGINPDDLDMSEVVNEYLNQLQGEIGNRRKNKQSLTNLPTPTAEQFLSLAASAKGYELLRDAKGRVRGMRPKGGK